MTRRAAVAAGALLVPGVLLPGCGGSDERDGGGGPGDVEALNAALAIEHRQAAFYEHAAATLTGDARQLAARAAGHERRHVGLLTEAVRDLGGRPVATAGRGDAGPPGLQGALDLERAAIAAYIQLLPGLTARRLRELVASIVAVEAEHLAAVSGALGLPEAPDAFVLGGGAP